MSHNDTMQLAVREVRMIVERILLAARVPQGFIPDVRDAVMYSHAMGLGGLSLFQQRFVTTPSLPLASMMVDGDTLDGGGNLAWMAAPSAIDFVVASHRTNGGALTVRNVSDIAELKLLEGFAGRYGALAHVTVKDTDTATVRVTADGNAHDAILEQALATGMPVPRALWQELYAFSHKALAKDSPLSRRHAGPVMVDAEGRVHGRDDDDSDFAFLFPDAGAKAVREQA
jgi:hypothetical protein